MAEKRSIGLKYIKLGEIAEDGGMGAALEALGVTFRDTASFIEADGSQTDFFSEENDDPEESVTIKGTTQLKWAIINLDPSALVRVLGGTANGSSWEAPAEKFTKELSVEFLSKTNTRVEIPRAKIVATVNWNLSRTQIAQVNLTATVMTPTKAGVGPFKITSGYVAPVV